MLLVYCLSVMTSVFYSLVHCTGMSNPIPAIGWPAARAADQDEDDCIITHCDASTQTPGSGIKRDWPHNRRAFQIKKEKVEKMYLEESDSD